MSKMIVIKKGVDKIVLLLDNKHIADITIAHSSRTSSVNLSIQADMDIKIEKSKFQPIERVVSHFDRTKEFKIKETFDVKGTRNNRIHRLR